MFFSEVRNRQSTPAATIRRRTLSTRRRYSAGGNSQPGWAGS
jgi:hypothetical protein